MNETPQCSLCGGSLAFLGQLGRLLWFRCINCGLDQCCQQQIEEESMPVPVHKTFSKLPRIEIENIARESAVSSVHQNEFSWTCATVRSKEAQA